MKFYLGTDRPYWLVNTPIDVPMMVSRRVLNHRTPKTHARVDWVLDSGGFTELSIHGGWQNVSPDEYAEAIERFSALGRLQWAAPQDWMCEPHMIERTGKSVIEHQELTVENYLDLSSRSLPVPVIPVLQGWTHDDYLAHLQMYEDVSVELASLDTVGLGSVCRRQATDEISEIVRDLAGLGLRLHGFGMKRQAFGTIGDYLTSADSMAWSYHGRRNPDPDCPKTTCNHCLHHALEWRDKTLARLNPS